MRGLKHIVEAAGGILYRVRKTHGKTAGNVSSIGNVRTGIDDNANSISNVTVGSISDVGCVGNDGGANDRHGDGGRGSVAAATTSGGGTVENTTENTTKGVTGGGAFPNIEVAVVHRPKYDDWSWPKGKLDPNESHRHAAVREIGEETGMAVALGPYLGEVEYPQSEEGCRKRHTKNHTVTTKHVCYWMATPIDGEDVRRRTAAFGPVHKADKGEIDELVWLTPAQARKRLTHSTDKQILALFMDRLEEGAARAVPFLIVRHAKAEARKAWKGTDANRPITPKGAAAAFALNREIACFNPVRVSSSPWIRCLETMEMFSWQTGRDMVPLPALTEDAFADDPQAAWRCFRTELEYASHQAMPTAICMHRPVIGGIFGHLRGLCASERLAKLLTAKSPYMPTGSALTLFVTPGPEGPRIIDIQKVIPLVY